MIDKYKPDEILKANKISQQQAHKQRIDNQGGYIYLYNYSNLKR